MQHLAGGLRSRRTMRHHPRYPTTLDLDVGDAVYFVEVADLEDHAAGAWHFGNERRVANDDRRRRHDDRERRNVRDRK